MSFKSKLSVLLAKTEVTYGTDSVPTGATNAILASNVKITPMVHDAPARNPILPYMANMGKVIGAKHGELAFDVELAGAGAAGTAPGYGVLLKGCAMGETINTGVSAVYAPISTGEQSLSIYFNVNGLQYKMLGARGTVSLKFTRGSIPMMSYKFIGLYSPVADVALPAPTLTAFKLPLVFNNANTTPVTLFTLAGAFADIQIDLAVKNVFRPLVGLEQVVFADRKPVGKVQMENVAIATKDFFTTLAANTTGALSITHGQTAGSKVVVAAPAVQLSNPAISSSDDIEMLDMAMELQPSTGNDEVTITVQ